MEAHAQLWLFVAGAAASVVNAAAGGGTMLSFPALLAVGLAPLQANATSTVALQAGLWTSAIAYRGPLRAMGPEVRRMIAPCAVGGALGAALALWLGARVFAAIVPALLVGGALLLFLQPAVKRLLARQSAQPLGDRPVAFEAAVFLLAVYCGYFGAGGGILFLAALGVLLHRPFDELNGLKNFALPASNGVGAITFIVIELSKPTGAVVWRAVPALALGALVGGFVGVRVAQRLPAGALRAVAGAIGVAMAIYIVAQ